MQTRTLAIRISKAERVALRQRARQEKLFQGDLVRRALRAYDVTPEPFAARIGYDVVKHLVGCYRGGPKDLSTNPKHLDGLGQ